MAPTIIRYRYLLIAALTFFSAVVSGAEPLQMNDPLLGFSYDSQKVKFETTPRYVRTQCRAYVVDYTHSWLFTDYKTQRRNI